MGDLKLRVLLDTGSTISALNDNTFLKTKYANKSLLSSEIKHIVRTGGATYPVKGKLKLNFKIGGLLLSQIFYIIPALIRHFIILGTDFCEEKSVCLNWNSQTLSLIKDSVTINVMKFTRGYVSFQDNFNPT